MFEISARSEQIWWNSSSSPMCSESDVLKFDECVKLLNATRQGDPTAFYLVKDVCSSSWLWRGDQQ